MKMYTRDWLEKGAIVIIADDRDHLQRILNDELILEDAVLFNEYDIVSGLRVTFDGDPLV